MGDLAPVLAAIGAILGALGVLVRNIGRLRRLFGVDQAELVANLRQLADTWEEKYGLVNADLVAERAAHGVTKELLVDEQRAGDRCRRQLAATEAELRGIGRRRTGPRG